MKDMYYVTRNNKSSSSVLLNFVRGDKNDKTSVDVNQAKLFSSSDALVFEKTGNYYVWDQNYILSIAKKGCGRTLKVMSRDANESGIPESNESPVWNEKFRMSCFDYAEGSCTHEDNGCEDKDNCAIDFCPVFPTNKSSSDMVEAHTEIDAVELTSGRPAFSHQDDRNIFPPPVDTDFEEHLFDNTIPYVERGKKRELLPDCSQTEKIGFGDKVNHPPHYTNHPSGVECIQITEHMGFNLGNAMKYIWRADLKNDATEDLNKAIWYINRELERRSKQCQEQ